MRLDRLTHVLAWERSPLSRIVTMSPSSSVYLTRTASLSESCQDFKISRHGTQVVSRGTHSLTHTVHTVVGAQTQWWEHSTSVEYTLKTRCIMMMRSSYVSSSLMIGIRLMSLPYRALEWVGECGCGVGG